jgi:exopolyphosphatase/guanosine-5'-triphosphate,3'-diphosphate pyrophosphatase
MILKMDIPGLGGDDRLMCALIARYHTKALPDATKHPRFASLNREKRNIVEWLSAILRVADALDSSHLGIVKKLHVRIDRKELVVRINANGDCWDEIRRAHRKEDLLVKKAERSMVYLC